MLFFFFLLIADTESEMIGEFYRFLWDPVYLILLDIICILGDAFDFSNNLSLAVCCV